MAKSWSAECIYLILFILFTGSFAHGQSVVSGFSKSPDVPVISDKSGRLLNHSDDFSSNLPLVFIDTQGKLILNDIRIVAHMGIVDNGDDKRNSVIDPKNNYNGKISIELRGNSSLDFPKKSYALETQTESGDNNNVPLLGLPAENDWILYAPYSDKSMMRNVLTFELARKMGRYAPRTRYCELFLNDRYQGIYVLMEKIKRDKNRVDISALRPEDIEGDELTGGYILKMDWWDSKSSGWESPVDGTLFHYHHPQKDVLADEQKRYIREHISEFEYTLDGDDYLHPVEGYRNYINMSSFVDYFISVELAHNADSYRLSTFFYKEKDSQGGKIHLGPLWDFNLAYGNQDEGPFGTPYQWSWERGLDPINFWWERFLSDSVFVDQIQRRWYDMRDSLITDSYLFAMIDSNASELAEARVRNFERWPILGEWVWPNAFVGDSYEEEVDYLKDFLDRRINWIDKDIEDLLIYTDPEEPHDPDNPNAEEYDERLTVSAGPNPFDSAVTLTYTINSPGDVKTIIYDMLGQKVRTLTDQYYEKGEYDIIWNGFNENHIPTSSGIYFLITMYKYELFSTLKLVKF